MRLSERERAVIEVMRSDDQAATAIFEYARSYLGDDDDLSVGEMTGAYSSEYGP